MEFKIRFSGKGHDYNEEEILCVVEAMKCADPYTQGEYLKEFEKDFCRYVGADQAFAVNTATSALELSAQLCQFRPGEEVIIPSHTFTATAYPFLKRGAKIVWADIDTTTRVVTVETLEKGLSPNTKAIVIVHLYGYVADMTSIVGWARKKNLIVIEDAAQSLGADIDGKKSGTFGDFGVFSFHSHKNITTIGEGGILLVKDKRIAGLVPMLRHNGHCSFPFERGDYWIPAMGNVDLPELNGERLMPSNFCIGEIQCALGSKLLERIDQINSEKRVRALRFIDGLKNYPELEFHRVDSSRHTYHLLVACMLNGKRDEFIRKMAREKGIQCIVQYCPLNRYPLYQKLGYGHAHCPNAELFFDNMISFPFHHWMKEDDFEYMLDSAKDVVSTL
ncbi:MAG: DegT/DnrJ/EryC1/StrS family aminotransferase [Thermodesulfobacteriota bacterium]